MASSDEIDSVLNILAVCYPEWGQKIDADKLADTINAYHATLRDIPGDLLRSAALHHVTRSQWFPKVSELRDAALSLVTMGRPTAEEAWGKVKAAIRAYGSYRVPEFDDPLVGGAVEIMGWRDLCMADIDQEGVSRAHFMRIYSALCARSDSEITMLPEVRASSRRLMAEHARGAIRSLAEAMSAGAARLSAPNAAGGQS